ncbi:MAG: crotonase [Gammaproteobacteria bacterium]|nr:crotonase [Gammaproteobacteria bacterium]
MQDTQTPNETSPEAQAKPPAPAAKKKATHKKKNSHKHWHLEKDDAGIAWLSADRANAGTNSLSAEVLDELGDILDSIAASTPKGLVIQSAKPSGFIAGADVKEFVGLKDTETAAHLIRRGQSVFDKIEALDCPTVAAINGFCLGGGLELALACRYRVADEDPRTRLGLPEVRLGIHPGFGGSMRLIRLIGAPSAMGLMLTGRTISARAAKKLGVVDYAVPARHLSNAARHLIQSPPVAHQPPRWASWLNHRLLRPALGYYLKRQVSAKASPKHYPAPYALIDLWVAHGDDPKAMLAEEAFSVAKLITGYTAQNLIRVFLLQEKLKGLAKTAKGKKEVFKRVHVIGGGVMGGDIAAWCALQGLQVSVQDRKRESLAKVMQRAHKLFKKKLKHPRIVQAAMDRLMPDVEGLGLRRADVVIEAIFEDVEAKQNLFKEVEKKVGPKTIIATNTSSIPLDEISSALKNPARLVGLHFFNPVAMMQLVEIVTADLTDKAVAQRTAAFTKQIKRLPLPVKSGPGFLVNRILMPYLMEAVVLESEGVPAPAIDKAAVDFGMPMGPIHLADTVGLDICLHVAENLSASLGGDIPKKLRKLVEAKQLGRKTGQGFYKYNKGKPEKPSATQDSKLPADLTDRLMLRMLNEAVACLRESVVDGEDLMDAGIIFGTGFAPFHGGPMHYLQHTGVDILHSRLQELAKRHGDRFKPDAGWSSLKEIG